MITNPAIFEIIPTMQGAARNERPEMGHSSKQYRIVVRGELGRRFEDEFQGMTLESEDGKTFLQGVLDQSQLHGVLGRVQSYNLEIIEVAEMPESDPSKGEKS